MDFGLTFSEFKFKNPQTLSEGSWANDLTSEFLLPHLANGKVSTYSSVL